MDTLKKFKYLIIIVVVIVVAFIAYTVYTNSDSSTSTSQSLQKTSASGAITTASGVTNNDLASGFVDQLLTIQNITLKTSFFSDNVFTSLKDNHVDIQPQEKSRPNPFAPIGQDSGQTSGNYQDINGAVINSTTGSVPSTIFGVTKTATTTDNSATTSPAVGTKNLKKKITAPVDNTQ